MFNLKYILTGGAIVISTLILISAPYRSEIKLAMQEKLMWSSSNIITHSVAYVSEALQKLKEYDNKLDARLLSLDARIIKAKQSREQYQSNIKRLTKSQTDFINQYRDLGLLGEDLSRSSRMKDLKSHILRLDSKIDTFDKKLSIVDSTIQKSGTLIDETYATKSVVEQKISELEVVKEEVTLKGNAISGGINLEEIRDILANVEGLNNHLERQALDNIVSDEIMGPDQDERFEAILKNAGSKKASYLEEEIPYETSEDLVTINL